VTIFYVERGRNRKQVSAAADGRSEQPLTPPRRISSAVVCNIRRKRARRSDAACDCGHEGACGRGGCGQAQPFSSQAKVAHHAVLAAEVVAAAQRQVLRPAKMGVDCPAEGAAWMLDVDRHGRAAAADDADDLAGVAGAFSHRRRTGVGHFAEIIAVAIGAAGADRQGTGGVRSTKRRDQKEGRNESARGHAQKPDHQVLPPGKTQKASSEGLPVGEYQSVMPGPFRHSGGELARSPESIAATRAKDSQRQSCLTCSHGFRARGRCPHPGMTRFSRRSARRELRGCRRR
jgi:hypothetical protein